MKICDHTQQVTNGCVFFAIPGKREDKSLENAKYACENGAFEIVAWESVCKQLQNHFPQIKFTPSSNPRAAYTQACIKQSQYHHQSKITAITGTKGKTSLSWILKQLLPHSGYIGTLGAYIYNEAIYKDDKALTSPKPEDLYQTLAKMEEKQVENIAFEYTSIGIDAQRCLEQFELGILTNFTGDDHLIYHGTVENYRICKLIMFEQCKICLINTNDPLLKTIKKLYPEKPIYTYSAQQNADLCSITYTPHTYGFEVQIYLKNQIFFEGNIQLLGSFQLDNLAGALAACKLLGKIEKINNLTETNLQTPGRMEVIGKIGSNSIILDYAHTPHSLEKAILALKEHKYEKIITVFGCGGDRDASKRPLMGIVSARLSDYTIITDDNPRTENAESIRQEILAQCDNGVDGGDRKKAIIKGIELLNKLENSALLIAGKGAEDYQIIGMEKTHFSDKETVEEALKYVN